MQQLTRLAWKTMYVSKEMFPEEFTFCKDVSKVAHELHSVSNNANMIGTP